MARILARPAAADCRAALDLRRPEIELRGFLLPVEVLLFYNKFLSNSVQDIAP
jgi:hypothetical protein